MPFVKTRLSEIIPVKDDYRILVIPKKVANIAIIIILLQVSNTNPS